MVSVAAGLGLGGAQKAFQASEQLRSREGIEQGRIQEARRKQALDSADAAILSITGEIKGLAKLRAVAEPGSRELHDIDRKIDALTKQGASVGAVYEKVGDSLRGARAFDSLRTAGQSIPGLAGLRGKEAGQEGAAQITAEAPARAAAAGQKKTAELEARREMVGQVLSAAGVPSDFSATLLTESEKSEAVINPFDDGVPPSADEQEYAQLVVASRRLMAAGLVQEGGAVLRQATALLGSSREMQRLRSGDKPISLELAREFGVPAGTTINEFNAKLGGGIPLSPEEVKRRGARATALGRGQPGAQEKVDLIQQTQGIIRGLVDEFQGKGKFVAKGANPNLFGVRGSFASVGKQALAVIGDLGLTEFVEQVTDLALTDTELTLDQIFEFTQSPTLSALDILQNTIGIVWANVRTKTGRVPLELIRTSIKEVKLTGLKGGQQVVDRLELVSKLIGGRGASLQKAFELGGSQPAPTPQAAQPAAPNIPVFNITGGGLERVQ